MKTNKGGKKTSKRTNPLYVVKNKGKDVEIADGLFDAFLKKLNLEKIYEFLKGLLTMMFDQVDSYVGLLVAEKMLEKFIEDLLVIQENLMIMLRILTRKQKI